MIPEHLIGAAEREAWRARRVRLEREGKKFSVDGRVHPRHWRHFELLVRIFGAGLRLTGLYERGVRNAAEVRLTSLELRLPHLPAQFDGFRILHLTDLHFDCLPQTTQAAIAIVTGLEADIGVLTGDYRARIDGDFHQIERPMQNLIRAMRCKEGILATLGNHDCAAMTEFMEAAGLRVLVNESMSLMRGAHTVQFTGIDDVHYYYTDSARMALESPSSGFKIVLAHSAEAAGIAASAGYSLYLCGHTHGGQVCLPGGRPIVSHLVRHRAYAAGLWQHNLMSGYTSTGVGVSAFPVRFNTRGEVVLLTLRSGDSGDASGRR